MRPSFVALNMYQGQTFDDSIVLEDAAGAPLDLPTLYDGARMQIRPYTQSPTIVMELTTDNGRLELGSDGSITFNVSAADTGALQTMYDYEQWVYDLELYKGVGAAERVDRPIMGAVVFWPEVTRNVV